MAECNGGYMISVKPEQSAPSGKNMSITVGYSINEAGQNG
jgi:hypothetical protein